MDLASVIFFSSFSDYSPGPTEFKDWITINHYSADSVVCFVNTYPLDSDLSGGYHYPSFEQPGPGHGCRFVSEIPDAVL